MTEGRAAERTLINVVWSYLSFAGTKVINLVTLIILARLLGPEEFGLMAICVVVIAYFEIVARFGLGAALVSAQDAHEDMADAVLVFALASSAIMAMLLALAAPSLAALFDAPAVTAPLRVIAVAIVIDAFGVVPSAYLARTLRFRQKMVPDLARSLVKGFGGIALALGGFGVWALIWGHVLGTAAAVLATYWVYPWMPRAWPRKKPMRDAFRFGRHLLGAELINAMQRNLDALLVGKLLGPAALGIYTLSFRLPDLVIRSFNQITGTVLHPVMSQMTKDPVALRGYYAASLRYVALFTFPAGVALAAAADPIVRILYTPDWYAMIPPMQYLAISLALLTVDFIPGLIYKATNRTEYLLYTSLLKLPVFFAVLVFAARYGVEGIAMAQIGLSLFYVLPNYLILRKMIGVGFAETIGALRPALFVSLCVGMAGFAAVSFGFSNALAQFALVGVSLTVTYFAALRLVAPEAFGELGRLLRRNRQKS